MLNIKEVDDYLVHLVIIAFLLTNFDQTIGLVYITLALVDIIYYYFAWDKNILSYLPIEKNKSNRLMNIGISIVLYFVFVYTSYFIISFTQHKTVDLSTAWTSIPAIIVQTFASTPVLAQSSILKVMIWGVLIPVVETLFFFRLITHWSSRYANVKPTVFSLSGQILAIFNGIIFFLFHVVAKGISNNEALLTTFLFGYFSVLIVMYFGEMVHALILHVINNLWATLLFLGAMNYTYLIVGIVFAWFLIFKELPFISRGSTI